MLRGAAATAYRFINETLLLNKNFIPKAIFPVNALGQVVDNVQITEKRGEFNVYEA